MITKFNANVIKAKDHILFTNQLFTQILMPIIQFVIEKCIKLEKCKSSGLRPLDPTYNKDFFIFYSYRYLSLAMAKPFLTFKDI